MSVPTMSVPLDYLLQKYAADLRKSTFTPSKDYDKPTLEVLRTINNSGQIQLRSFFRACENGYWVIILAMLKKNNELIKTALESGNNIFHVSFNPLQSTYLDGVRNTALNVLLELRSNDSPLAGSYMLESFQKYKTDDKLRNSPNIVIEVLNRLIMHGRDESNLHRFTSSSGASDTENKYKEDLRVLCRLRAELETDDRFAELLGDLDTSLKQGNKLRDICNEVFPPEATAAFAPLAFASAEIDTRRKKGKTKQIAPLEAEEVPEGELIVPRAGEDIQRDRYVSPEDAQFYVRQEKRNGGRRTRKSAYIRNCKHKHTNKHKQCRGGRKTKHRRR